MAEAGADVRITPPPGYTRLELLDRRRHAGLGLAAAPGYAWSAALPAVALGAVEIARAALDYPVVFSRDPRDQEFVPMAVLGARHNLFVDDRGHWRAGCYVPAYLRRWPFCTAQLPTRDGRAGRSLICVEAGTLGRSALALFDSAGEPTEAFAPMRSLIDAMEAARQQTRVLSKRLESLDLLLPFDAVIRPTGAAAQQIRGLYRVDEARLAKRSAAELQGLLRKGELKAIYAHLLSLENFARLLPE
jgi:hypothetical protein